MKNCILFICLLFSTSVIAQSEVFLDNLNKPSELFVTNDYMYFSIFESQEDGDSFGALLRYDLTRDVVQFDTIITVPREFSGIYFLGDTLLYSYFFASEIYYLDISKPKSTPSIFIDSIYWSRDMEVVENRLFIVGSDDPNYAGYLLEYDLDTLSKKPLKYFEGLEPLEITHHDGSIYATTRRKDSIEKLNINNNTTCTVIDSMNNLFPIRSVGNILFFADVISEITTDGRIFTIDVNDPNKEQNLLTEEVFRQIHDFAVYDGFLYFSEFWGGISRIRLPQLTNSNDYIVTDNKEEIYPNPAVNEIRVDNSNVNRTYHIYSILGTLYQTGQLGFNSTIDISSLPNGSYFIYFENGYSEKFNKIK